VIDIYYLAGTFYILIFISALGLKSQLLNRNVTVNLVVDSLAFAMRNPECEFQSLLTLYLLC
jgi:hypothetical protein